MFKKIEEMIKNIKATKPLILNITNDVTMGFVANGLLSLGASPIMSKSEIELLDLIEQAKSLVINIGTLNEHFIQVCMESCQLANQLNKPIVLDPVGAGASQYRTNLCLSILENHKISIIRGNASEILALGGVSCKTHGVDSLEDSEFAIESAKKLSIEYDSAIIVSGKVDIIVDHLLMMKCHYGSAMMPMITGVGCLFSAVIAAFHSIEANRFESAKQGTLFYGMCSEITEKKTKEPGSFQTEFLNTLHSFSIGDDYDKN